MKLTLSSTVIVTQKFDMMKSFYQDVLFQEIDMDFGNCLTFTSGLSLWQLKEDYPIAKKLGRTYSDLGNNNLEICFETDEFDAISDALKQNNIKYLHEKEEESWGQQTIRFFDPENNLIEIGESISCFVLRFYNGGMTTEEVATRTSVPINVVEEIVAKQ